VHSLSAVVYPIYMIISVSFLFLLSSLFPFDIIGLILDEIHFFRLCSLFFYLDFVLHLFHVYVVIAALLFLCFVASHSSVRSSVVLLLGASFCLLLCSSEVLFFMNGMTASGSGAVHSLY